MSEEIEDGYIPYSEHEMKLIKTIMRFKYKHLESVTVRMDRVSEALKEED